VRHFDGRIAGHSIFDTGDSDLYLLIGIGRQ
jgi:hypothetical protein